MNINAKNKKGRVVLVINVKGGIGKTTSIINFGAGLYRKGYKVALVDNDPQASTASFFKEKYPEKKNIETLFKVAYAQPEHLSETLEVVAQEFEGVDGFAPTNQWASFGAKFSDQLLAEQFGKIFNVMREKYDFIFIDCPQGGDKNTQAMFCVADGVIMPIQTQTLCLESTTSALSLFDYIREEKNTKLKLYIFLATMYEGQKNNQKAALKMIEETWAGVRNVPLAIVRKQVLLEEMRVKNTSVFSIDEESYGAVDYNNAIDIFLKSVKELHNGEN